MKRCVLCLAIATALDAQTLAERLSLVRLVRTGPRPAEASPVAAYSAAGAQVDVVGLKSITGTPQVWLIETHGSFSSIEALDRALAQAAGGAGTTDPVVDELLATSNNLIGALRPGLSYRPEEAIRLLASARFVLASVYRMRPGADVDFAELMKLRRAGLDAVNLDKPEIGYQVVSGSLSGTFVFLSPLQSLQSMDQGLARPPAYAEGLAHAGGKTGKQIISEAEITREHLLFRVEPRFSFVSDAFAAADPEFWHPASR